MKTTKQRFVCQKHGAQCEVVFKPGAGGQFHSCPVCFAAGDKFTVQGREPHYAYGNTAEEMGCYGAAQDLQTFPVVREMRKASLKAEYDHFLESLTPDEESDFRLLKRSIELYVHPLGGKYRKVSIDDVRFDLKGLRKAAA